MIGYAICGSYCTHKASLSALSRLVEKYDVLPILSCNTASTDTRFGTARNLISSVTELTGREPVMTIKDAEPLGPKSPLEALVICPCTGNTLAKLACAITDTPVTMAAKAHLRSDRTLLIALASNDALAANLANIGSVLSRKNIFFVPMRQDDIVAKPHSLVADFSRVPEALDAALAGKQLRPLFM